MIPDPIPSCIAWDLLVWLCVHGSRDFTSITLAAVVCLVGCASIADVARYETSSVCEVHHSAMIVEEVPCISGTSVYLRDFSGALSREFPHHGRAHFVEDHVYLYARRMKLHVCPECTKAYDEWHAQRRLPDLHVASLIQADDRVPIRREGERRDWLE